MRAKNMLMLIKLTLETSFRQCYSRESIWDADAVLMQYRSSADAASRQCWLGDGSIKVSRPKIIEMPLEAVSAWRAKIIELISDDPKNSFQRLSFQRFRFIERSIFDSIDILNCAKLLIDESVYVVSVLISAQTWPWSSFFSQVFELGSLGSKPVMFSQNSNIIVQVIHCFIECNVYWSYF